MEGGRCFLMGHRDAPETIRPALRKAVEDHILLHGVREFYVGQYGRFDAMAAHILADVKARFPDIRLYLLTPYHPAERAVVLPGGFDGGCYPFDQAVPRRAAIVAANQAMIDRSDFLIVYVSHPGNARELLLYARRRAEKGRLRLLNLADAETTC